MDPEPVGGLGGSLLREIEERHERKHIESVKTPKGAQAGRGPIQVMKIQMCADL